MPELPDVEYYKRYIDATALHHEVDNVEVNDVDLLEDVTVRKLTRRLKGHPFASTVRHGKFLFLEIDGDGWVVLHFGMTGFVRYCRHEKDLPKHARVVFTFRNGYRLAYDCQRKLGLVSLTDNVDAFVEERKLGIDAMDDTLDLHRFRDVLSGRRGSIKSTLMNQSLIAGIGNVYSDEILFRARVRPDRKVNTLDDDDLRAIHKAVGAILSKAADCHAEPERMPRSFLTPHRKEGQACPRCHGTLSHKKISGRTSYFCDHCQS